MKFSVILVPAIAAAALLAAPALAEVVSEEEYGPLPAFEMASAETITADEPESFDTIVSDDELSANRGGAGIVQLNKGIVIGNTCDGCSSGNNVNNNSFNNLSGVALVIENTGAQAVINGSVAVNLYLDSNPVSSVAR